MPIPEKIPKKTNVLLTPADVRRYREKLLKDQKGIDPITKQPAESPALDHSHDTQLVRAVLSRQINVMLGKIENSYIRYVRWWCNVPLPDLLEGFAEYLRLPHKDTYHPKALSKALTEFSKLSSQEMKIVLNSLGLPQGNNSIARKAAFKKYIAKGSLDYKEIIEMLEQAKRDSKEVHP